jgi:Ca2+-binding RTX toxin-like protein
MNTKSLALSLVALGAALTPAVASAARVELVAGDGAAGDNSVSYTAGKGERNRLTVTATPKNGVFFSDPGARIRAVKGPIGRCKISHNGHRARCLGVDNFNPLDISLGDRNDKLRFKGKLASKLGTTARTDVTNAFKLADRYRPTFGGALFRATIDGGRGNDDLGGTVVGDFLAPGSGRDLVDGGKGGDVILAGADGTQDVLRGGGGIDDVTGAGAAPLTIDLGKGTFGAGGDVDTLNSIERAHGGAGDDMLIGSEQSDGLFGQGGDDTVDGRGGPDYLGGDLQSQSAGSGGSDGVDALTGGAGDDVLDGRDDRSKLTPTDQLACGDGTDHVVGLQDDLVDASCELSAWGVFRGDIYSDQFVAQKPSLPLQPVARGADGAPTYEVACLAGAADCLGRVQLEAPPVTGAEKDPTVYGTGEFTIKTGEMANVPVVLNDAGKLALAQPGARASVHVLVGAAAGKEGSQTADFGWQQVLGPQ